MSNGFGAAFGGLLLLAVLLGLAVALALTAAAAVVSQRRTGAVHDAVSYSAVALLCAVLVVAGFGLLAMYDEAPPVAALFPALVFVPLGGAAHRLNRDTRLARDDLAAATAMAWAASYAAGVGVLVVLVAGVVPALGLSPGQVGQYGLPWLETAVAGLVALLTGWWAAPRLAARFP